MEQKCIITHVYEKSAMKADKIFSPIAFRINQQS